MKEINIYSYYAFGYNYRILRSELETDANAEAAKRLMEFLEKVNELELQVTSQIVVIGCSNRGQTTVLWGAASA